MVIWVESACTLTRLFIIRVHCFVFQLSLITGEEVEIEYEVDGWYYVSSHLTIDFTCL